MFVLWRVFQYVIICCRVKRRRRNFKVARRVLRRLGYARLIFSPLRMSCFVQGKQSGGKGKESAAKRESQQVFVLVVSLFGVVIILCVYLPSTMDTARVKAMMGRATMVPGRNRQRRRKL